MEKNRPPLIPAVHIAYRNRTIRCWWIDRSPQMGRSMLKHLGRGQQQQQGGGPRSSGSVSPRTCSKRLRLQGGQTQSGVPCTEQQNGAEPLQASPADTTRSAHCTAAVYGSSITTKRLMSALSALLGYVPERMLPKGPFLKRSWVVQ